MPTLTPNKLVACLKQAGVPAHVDGPFHAAGERASISGPSVVIGNASDTNTLGFAVFLSEQQARKLKEDPVLSQFPRAGSHLVVTSRPVRVKGQPAIPQRALASVRACAG